MGYENKNQTYVIENDVDEMENLEFKKKMKTATLRNNQLPDNYETEEDKNNLNLLKAEVKIIDFGFATHLDGSHLRYSILGSPINMDPILLTKLNNQNLSYLIGYDEKADIWSLGTVCYEMATGETLFPVQNINQLVQRVEIGIYHIPIYISQELVSFLEGMLQYLGKDRLNAVELSYKYNEQRILCITAINSICINKHKNNSNQ